MELFAVKRYDDEVANQNPEKEDEILEKLLKKVEKKKRKLKETNAELEAHSDIKDTGDIGQVVSDEKQPKKIKIDVDDAVSQAEFKKPEIPQKAEDREDFKVLGENVFSRKKRVDMVLPPWLAHPTIIATKLSENTEDEIIQNVPYISELTKDNLKAMEIEKFFPVQKEVIPWILDAHSKPLPFRPRDICVSAPTGSGKTLAFAVPIVELLSSRVERKIRALVVLPVNELAQQVFRVFKKLASNTNLSIILLSKSGPLAKEQHQLVDEFKGRYFSKVDIVITTPGRLVEHLHATKGFCLKHLKFLVIDEADKIMEQIHHNWLYHLDNHVKSTSDMMLSGRSAGLSIIDLEGEAQRQPHKLLFSATLSQDPEKLQNLKLFQPKLFTSVVSTVKELTDKLMEKSQENEENEMRGEFVGKYTTPDELTEKYCITEGRLKPLTLYSLICQNKWERFLCFTNSALGAHRLAFILQLLHYKHLKIAELSASLSTKSRAIVLKRFALGEINGIVCSDALARGIDIPEVDVVISYDVPRHIKTYIHRIGRTARAGRPGTAVALLSTKEFTTFKHILGEAGKTPNNEISVEGNIEEQYAKQYSAALQKLKKTLESERFIKNKKKKGAKEQATKVTSEMTAMEKLQLEVGNALECNDDVTENPYLKMKKSKGKKSRQHE